MLMNSFCAYKGEHNIVSLLGGAGCCRGFLLVVFYCHTGIINSMTGIPSTETDFMLFFISLSHS